ncbi:DUF86 domain-containing protein [Patescibacteria group bacterium]|nr:DUF86 domain-containing protein [Patescibacteria group bacterium]MBU1563838.1 DUF86 domain-containing protein [Patescibacteria group bacterium]MBU2068350.1 DUF86 domain-containing protein [Patescibacteria group bacterium]
MTNSKTIENKISLVKKYIKILDNYKKYSKDEIQDDQTIKGAVERYLYLSSQATIDLAEAIISYKGFRKPTSMSESFSILNEEKIIPLELTNKMIGMVGFRNVVTHDYDKINYDIVYDVLQNKLEDIEKFLKIIAKII